jgi:hypothetical protein
MSRTEDIFSAVHHLALPPQPGQTRWFSLLHSREVPPELRSIQNTKKPCNEQQAAAWAKMEALSRDEPILELTSICTD